MKKGLVIGLGVVISIIVIIFGISWFVGNESMNNPKIQLPSVNTTTPVGHSYRLNFTESIGIHANP